MSDPIDRLNAALEGRYRIERELGEGGMATVYLAADLRHKRNVALKVLKPELAAVVGAERFLTEIETTAGLQHPHILPLHDSGEADGLLFYVMPFIEGESLRARLDREKQLPVDEAVRIATDLAEALDYAHRQSVIHRDIKPANVLLHEGRPLIADFGIALAVSAAGGGRLTDTGLSLGTPHYMSPEQATGDREVDARSDVYALGCVLYEMLVGEPPFTGTTAQAVLAKILAADAPRPTAGRSSIPPNVDSAIRRSLERLAADRFATAGSLAAALADSSFQHRAPAATVGRVEADRWRRTAAAVTAVAAAFALALVWALGRPVDGPPGPVLRTALTGLEVPLTGSGKNVSISRDGSKIAVVGIDEDGAPRLYIRDSNHVEFRAIPGTENADHPTFSPDGEWLAFMASPPGEVRRVPSAGGSVQTLAAHRGRPHWGTDDLIVYADNQNLWGVAPSGGQPTLIFDSVGARNPFLLPDGETVVFQSGAVTESNRLMVGRISSRQLEDVGILGNSPLYVSTGHLLYGNADQSLLAVPFDAASREVRGEPAVVFPGMSVFPGGSVPLAVSEAGTAVYSLAGQLRGRLVEVDPTGTVSRLPLPDGDFREQRFSPDGRYIAYSLASQIWIFDRETGSNDLLTEEGLNWTPVWGPDGREIYFSTRRIGTRGPVDLARRRMGQSSETAIVTVRDGRQIPVSVSRDGRSLLITEGARARGGRGFDLTIVNGIDGDPVFEEYLRADWNEYHGAISPDGTWVAYTSDESGQPEVFVRSFPDAQNPVRVSLEGGTEPAWAPDGNAIYYRAANAMMRAAVLGGESFTTATPELLFETSWRPDNPDSPNRTWDIHPDGRRFLLVTHPETSAVGGAQLEIVVNFFEELKQRVPSG